MPEFRPQLELSAGEVTLEDVLDVITEEEHTLSPPERSPPRISVSPTYQQLLR